jgi:hypothetical protein
MNPPALHLSNIQARKKEKEKKKKEWKGRSEEMKQE